MKITLAILLVTELWLLFGFIWNHFHPDEPEKDYDECPYD